jgi:ABC-2 type transport system permease protein
MTAAMTLLRLEITKLRYQKRTWVGLGGLAIVPIVATIALYLSHGNEGGPRDALPLIAGQLKNGLFIPLFAVVILGAFLLPLATSMIGANTIAGEAEAGTIKTVLVRPVRRGSLLSAKWAISVGYLAVALTVVFVVGLVAGLIAFGLHGVFIHLGPIQVSFSIGHTLWLTFLAYVLQLVSMTAVLSFAIMLSTLTNSSLTAAVGSLVIVLVVEILLQFSYFAFLRPYVFTTYFSSGADLFKQPIPWGTIVRGVLCAAAWSAGFGLVAWRQFGRRDILV